jgi:hypothetical protein
MQIKRRLAVLTVALTGLAGLGTGVATAQASAAATPPVATASAPGGTGLHRTGVAEAVEELRQASQPAGGYPDALVQGVDHDLEVAQ